MNKWDDLGGRFFGSTPKYLPHAPSSSKSNLQGIGLLLHIWVVLPNKVYTWRRGGSPPPFGREWFQPLWRFEDMKDWLKNQMEILVDGMIISRFKIQLHFADFASNVCVWWICFATCPTKTMQNSTAWTTWSFNLNTNQSYFTKAPWMLTSWILIGMVLHQSGKRWFNTQFVASFPQYQICSRMDTAEWRSNRTFHCWIPHFPTSYWDASLVGEILDKRGNSLQREVKVLIVMDNHGWMFRITSRDLIHE